MCYSFFPLPIYRLFLTTPPSGFTNTKNISEIRKYRREYKDNKGGSGLDKDDIRRDAAEGSGIGMFHHGVVTGEFEFEFEFPELTLGVY